MKVQLSNGQFTVVYPFPQIYRGNRNAYRVFTHTFNNGGGGSYFFMFTNFTLAGGHVHGYEYGPYPTLDLCQYERNIVMGGPPDGKFGFTKGKFFNKVVRHKLILKV